MPRATELIGYRFIVNDIQIPDTDPKDGQIIHDALGRPKMLPGKQIVFFDQLGDQIRVPLGEPARHELVTMLTGGIAVPKIEIAH